MSLHNVTLDEAQLLLEAIGTARGAMDDVLGDRYERSHYGQADLDAMDRRQREWERLAGILATHIQFAECFPEVTND